MFQWQNGQESSYVRWKIGKMEQAYPLIATYGLGHHLDIDPLTYDLGSLFKPSSFTLSSVSLDTLTP